ncbi:hypothetical protein M2M59_01205 [Rummeliibacillus sp. G93]|uniref:EutP/PduV family microcompartment system protein n=1 Tax=Rummeliibacillus TaxID=648802 RepID=UPI00201C529F|nr:EutP/PduV family microcompartment system protein [Rummeliibacillus sp. G93]UQW97652.1 hypothetical protein M2M59_01205 [Rummeliibacillus sp. G93]
MDKQNPVPIPKRIHIIGSIGSGKTTLAKKLSDQLSIPYFNWIMLFGKGLTLEILNEANKRETNI